MINSHNGTKTLPKININKYSAIKKHLDKYYKQIKNRDDQGDTPYNLRSCAYMEDFFKQKIVWGNISYNSSFCIVEKDIFINAPANLLVSNTINLYYLLAILNSKIFNWEFKQIGIFLGNAFEWKKQYVEQIHIPKYPNEKIVKEIENLQKQNSINENKIEEIIYKLYKLSDEEIKYIKELSI